MLVILNITMAKIIGIGFHNAIVVRLIVLITSIIVIIIQTYAPMRTWKFDSILYFTHILRYTVVRPQTGHISSPKPSPDNKERTHHIFP